MNNVIRGGDMMLFLTKGDKTLSIAMATNHTLTLSGETKDISSKDHGGLWAASEMGLLSWTCNSENVATTGEDGLGYEDLVELMISREKVHGVFTIEGNSSTTSGAVKENSVPEGGWTPKANSGYEGDMFITNIQVNAQNGENMTFTVDFTGVGPLSKVKGA